LHLRLGDRFHTTRDMDLARYDNELAATADFLAAQALDLGDYFQFDIRKTARLDAVLEGAAVRYHTRRPIIRGCHGRCRLQRSAGRSPRAAARAGPPQLRGNRADRSPRPSAQAARGREGSCLYPDLRLSPL